MSVTTPVRRLAGAVGPGVEHRADVMHAFFDGERFAGVEFIPETAPPAGL